MEADTVLGLRNAINDLVLSPSEKSSLIPRSYIHFSLQETDQWAQGSSLSSIEIPPWICKSEGEHLSVLSTTAYSLLCELECPLISLDLEQFHHPLLIRCQSTHFPHHVTNKLDTLTEVLGK